MRYLHTWQQRICATVHGSNSSNPRLQKNTQIIAMFETSVLRSTVRPRIKNKSPVQERQERSTVDVVLFCSPALDSV